jgi:GT2 family glycosyltransferase
VNGFAARVVRWPRMQPSLSIIMPVYNGEQYVSTSLESVRSQADDNIEVVIVDDGSTDRTLDIVSGFSKQLPLRVIRPGRLGSWVAATNLGLREATGEWACFLHHDDHWLPDRLARVRQLAATAEGELVLHNACFVGPRDEKLGAWTCPLSGPVVSSQRFLESLLVQNFIAISAPLFRRTTALETGGLDKALWHTADWDLWLRLGSMGPVSFTDEILTVFRVHDDSQTSARALRPGEWEEQLTTVLDRHLPQLRNERQRRQVRRTALASVAVNATLAAISRGNPANWGRTLSQVLRLGPSGWIRYVRKSRIVQRLGARVRVRLRTSKVHERSIKVSALGA